MLQVRVNLPAAIACELSLFSVVGLVATLRCEVRRATAADWVRWHGRTSSRPQWHCFLVVGLVAVFFDAAAGLAARFTGTALAPSALSSWQCVHEQVCRSSLLSGRNVPVRWPRRMLPPGESRQVWGRCRQTDGRVPVCQTVTFRFPTRPAYNN